MQKIVPSLWFAQNANDAIEFYKSVFQDFNVDFQTSVQTPFDTTANIVGFNIFGYHFFGLDGPREDENNPSVSFLLAFDDEDELVSAYKKLSAVDLMALEKYDFSGGEYYGWCMDKFGVSWQVWMEKGAKHRVRPQLLCINDNNGKAEEMLDYYAKIFEGSVGEIHEYHEGMSPDADAKVMLGTLEVYDQQFFLQDGGADIHKFDFNYGVSFIVNVADQEEYDAVYESLLGTPEACGWVKDPYGVSFQVLPDDYFELVQNKGQVVADEIFKMTKLDIDVLRNAGNN